MIPNLLYYYSTRGVISIYLSIYQAPSEPVELPADDDETGDDIELAEDEDEQVTYLNI